MRHCDETVKINHNSDWSYISDHLYKILVAQDQAKLMCY